MNDHDLETMLARSRVGTTEDLDRQILAAARPRRPRRLFPALAAAVFLAIVATGFGMKPEPAEPGVVVSFNRRPLSSREPSATLTHLNILDYAARADGQGQYAVGVRPTRPRSEMVVRFSESLNPSAVLKGQFGVEPDQVYNYRSAGGGGGGGSVKMTTTTAVDLPAWDEGVTSGFLAGEGRFGPSLPAYDPIVENRFLDPRRDPLSTFSIDVDTASYANVRRLLNEGQLPPAGAVRIEELVNSFRYHDPEPTNGRPFAVATEVAECPWAPTHRLLRVGLQGRRIDESAVPPRNLVFLLDVSGSMQPAAKLPLVKQAMKLLTEQFREEDNVSIVVYAGASGVVLEPTSGHFRSEILSAIERLDAGGGTNGAAGIRAAYDLAAKNFDPAGINRVILATDGDFNLGTTDRTALERLIEKERETGVFLTVLGVGGDNLKDSQMEALADKGNGNYHFLDSLAEAKRVLVEEAGSTLVTIAKDVKIQVEFNPARVGAYRLIGYENRVLAAEDFADDRKDAGEIGAGHSVTALYEIVPAGEAVADAGDVEPLRYQLPRYPAGSAHPDELLTVKLRYKEPDGDTSTRMDVPVADAGNANWTAASADYRWAAAVAAFGMLLRGSEYAGATDFDLVDSIARGAAGEDDRRAEFLDLVAKAKALAAAAAGKTDEGR